MAVEGGDKGRAVLGADVVLEFEKSINNIRHFAQVMEELDARFGRIEQRVDALRSSLSSLSSQTSRGSGNQLRRAIEEELNNIIAANGVVLSSVGNAPFRIKQDTVRHIFRRIDAELNRAIARSIGDINIKLDPNFYSGQFALGKSEFEAFNREVARLVRTHVSTLVDNIRKSGAELVNPEEFKGLQLTISRGTVKEIMQSIKRQLLPIIMNPEVPKEGISFQLSTKDVRNLANKLKQQIIASLEIGVDNLTQERIELSDEYRNKMLQATREVDGYINRYIDNIRRGVASLDTSEMVVPLENMTRSLKKYIARDLGISVQNLEKTFDTLKVGEVTGYELRRQFSSLESVINTKMRTGVSSFMEELKRSVRDVEIHPQPRLKHYLINEIAKLNNEIVKKIREQIDEQFKAMRAEIQTVSTTPKQINRSGRIRRMADGYAQLESGQSRPYASHLPPVPQAPPRPQLPSGFGSDPYARRDAYFNAFGLQGAIVNTVRHILAGGVVGTPIMLVYSALDAFKTSQLEQVKMFQNLMLKEDYQDEQGNILYSQVQADIQSELVPAIKELSVLYGISYDEMSKAAAVGTRSLNNPLEVRQFLDYAGMIQRLDSEADLAEVVAPGLEAIKNQFNMSVWNLDQAVISLAVASNATKATTEELIQALQRSGSSLYMTGLDVMDASSMASIFLHYTGLSGSDIGNMLKSITSRLGMATHVRKLEEEYGIQIYETDDRGLRRMRSMVDILTDIANLSIRTNMDEEELQAILFSQAGGYQINKLKAGIEAFADPELALSDLNYHTIREQMDRMDMDEIDTMLANSLNSTIMSMERAWTAVQASLVSVLEELSPEIRTLMQNITNLANNVRDSAGLIEDFLTIVGNSLIGYAAVFGGRKLLNAGGYKETLENIMTVDRILGRRGWKGEITKEGNINQLLPVLGDLSADINNRRFLETALRDATLASFITELSNMDERRLNEFKTYLENNKPKGLEDFFMAIQESRGYKAPERLSAEDIHNRAAHNARMISQNKALASVMSREFLDEFMTMFANRESYLAFNSTLENRRLTRQLARMTDADLRAFEQYVVTNYATGDRRIESAQDLKSSLTSFREEQTRIAEEIRRSTPTFIALSSAIEKTRNQLTKPIGNVRNTIIDFINELPNKARSGASALLNLGRSLARFAAQAGMFFVLGDIIGNWASYTAMSATERRQKELEVRIQRTSEEYIASFDQGSAEKATSALMRFVNSITNALSPGVHGVDQNMLINFEREFTNWLRENYNSRNVQRVAEREGKTVEDLVNEYLGASGLQRQLSEVNQQVFDEQARQARLDEEIVQNMREAADKERMEQEVLRELMSQGFYYTRSHLLDMLEQLNEDLTKSMQLEELEALLRGVKTYSDEYFNLQKRRLQGELNNQREILAGLEQFINEQERYLRELEEKGMRWTIDPETGERVETDAYRQTVQNIERETKKLEQLREDFRPRELEIQLEMQNLEVSRALAKAEHAIQNIEFARNITDLSNALYMDRNTVEYIDAQMESQRRYIDSLKEVLDDLKAQDLVDPNDELKRRIMSLEETIASAEVAMKDLALRRITGYRYDLERFDLEQEIEYLRAQVSLGTTDSNHPALRQLRMSQGSERRLELERIMADLRAEMSKESNPEIIEAYQRELLQIERDSLRTQLSMLEELRGGTGTFNVPEGLRVMTEYEYMRSLGTHTSYSFGLGDMNVNITLPNITNATTPEQMKIIAESIAVGMMNGRLSSLRHMMAGGPWGYKAR